MSTPASSASTTTTKAARFIAAVRETIKPYTVPYYLTVMALIGAITTVFAVLIGVIILIATNFNVLGLIE